MYPIRNWLTASGLLLFSQTGLALEQNQAYTLQQAIDLALTNNPEMTIMQSRIEQANAQFGESVSSFYPQIKTSLSYLYSNNPAQAFSMIIAQRRLDLSAPTSSFNYPGFVSDYRPQVSASYNLFKGGQDYYNSQAAELSIETSELEKTATKHRLINHVTAAFYSELAAQDAKKISDRSIAAVDSELQQSQAGYEAGSILKSDVLSLQVQLAEAKDAQIHSTHAVDMAHSMLKTLLGLPNGDHFSLQSSANETLPQSPKSFDQLLSEALAHHPELKAAENRVMIAEKQLSAAKAAHLPKADAMIAYGSDSSNLAYSSNRDNMTAGVSVEMDLFSGFATQEKIHKAEHQLTAAQELARKTRLSIEDQLKSASLKLQEALNRAEISQAACQSAEEAFRLVSHQRQAGTITVTRYLEAQVALDKTLNRRMNARFDAYRADADLKQAIGYW